MKALSYKRVGTMTYDVHDDSGFIGTVWRTRTGWSAARPNGVLVTEDYPGSRATAAGLLKPKTAAQTAVYREAADGPDGDPFAGLS